MAKRISGVTLKSHRNEVRNQNLLTKGQYLYLEYMYV
jgi:hypothetical protein